MEILTIFTKYSLRTQKKLKEFEITYQNSITHQNIDLLNDNQCSEILITEARSSRLEVLSLKGVLKNLEKVTVKHLS